MLNYFSVMIGGALGTAARFWVSGVMARCLGQGFPFGTLAVNVTGSFIVGFFAAMTETEAALFLSSRVRQFFVIGVCGGYTTFSAFSLQTLDLAEDGDWLKAAVNALFSFAGCILAVWLGRVCALQLKTR